MICKCGKEHNGTYGTRCEDCWVDESAICVRGGPDSVLDITIEKMPRPEKMGPKRPRKKAPIKPATAAMKEKMFRLTNPRGL